MRSRSAAVELTLLAVLVMAALLVAFTWLSIQWQQSWLLNEVQRGLSLASDTLQSALRDGMMHNRRDQILVTIERVSRDTRIKRILIINHRGEIKLATNPRDVNGRVDMGAPGCSICHQGTGKNAILGTLTSAARTRVEGNMALGLPLAGSRFQGSGRHRPWHVAAGSKRNSRPEQD
jgi:hypothetical protein